MLIHLYKIYFFTSFCFPIYNNVYPKYFQRYKKRSINEIRDLIFENCKLTAFSKENNFHSMKRLKEKYLLLLASKLTEKIPHPRNAKEHYQFITNKNTKSVKQSKAITQQPKAFKNSNIVDIKSIIMEDPKASHKLSKTIRQAEKGGCNSSLYSDTKKAKNY